MRRRNVPLARCLGDYMRRWATRRRNDHHGNMELRLVETRPVPEHARFFAETFAVIRRDDHPRPLENGTAIEFVDQSAKLLIELRDAIVITVDSEADLDGEKVLS